MCQEMMDYTEHFGPRGNEPGARAKIQSDVYLSPNPVQHILRFYGTKSSKYELSIYKTTGELIHESEIVSTMSIDCSTWIPAVYIYNILDKNTGNKVEGKLVKY